MKFELIFTLNFKTKYEILKINFSQKLKQSIHDSIEDLKLFPFIWSVSKDNTRKLIIDKKINILLSLNK